MIRLCPVLCRSVLHLDRGGTAFLVTPASLKHGLLRPVLCFLHGVALFTVVNVYGYTLDLTVSTALWISGVVGILLLEALLVAVGRLRSGLRLTSR